LIRDAENLLSIPAPFHYCVYTPTVTYSVRELILFISVDTSVFGFSPGNLFAVDSFAKRSLIISSIAAAIGLFIDAWFIFAYSGADVRKFQVSLSSSILPTCNF
jgi:hypothetical protein